MLERDRLIVLTRASPLAMAQAKIVADALRRRWPDLDIQVRPVSTRADRMPETPLSQMGGKGLFTAELARALLAGEADLAVHSAKDLPARQPAGLDILCVPPRGPVEDAFVGAAGMSFERLPPAARVGTSSLRRRVQLSLIRPDLTFVEIRGNVDTRVRKVRSGQYDGVVLALAGLRRIGLDEAVTETFPVDRVLPAPGEGALAVQGRADDEWLRHLLEPVNDPIAESCLRAERTLTALLNLDCRGPFAALAEPAAGGIRLRAMLASSDGSRLIRADVVADEPQHAAALAAERLREAGGDLLAKNG